MSSANRNLATSRLSGHRDGWPLRSSRGLLAATLTLLSGGFQLAVALSVNLDLSACKHIVWCHVADRTVQPDVVIGIHILLDQAFWEAGPPFDSVVLPQVRLPRPFGSAQGRLFAVFKGRGIQSVASRFIYHNQLFSAQGCGTEILSPAKLASAGSCGENG